MTERSQFWTGRISEGAAGDAGPYSAARFAEMVETFFGQNKANRGVLRGVDGELAVTASSPADTNINVATGAGLVQGSWYLNNASAPVAIASNSSGAVRIDIIVLVADYVAQTVRIAVVQGTPAAGLPALTQSAGSIWQIPLAYITLASGFTSIAISAITDLRHYANIPSAIGYDVTNSSGATLEIGSAVIWLAGGGQAINTTTTEGNRNIAGVIESRVLNAAVGRIIVRGIVPVLCDELVSVGDLLELSTTAGQAQKTVRNGIFARVLVANTGAGTRCLADVNVPLPSAIETGTYTGDGNTTKAITGLGFKPRMVQLWRQNPSGGTVGAFFVKTDQDGSTNAMTVNARNAGLDNTWAVYSNDAIRSLDADGFTVGDTTDNTANQTNANGVVYTWVAYR